MMTMMTMIPKVSEKDTSSNCTILLYVIKILIIIIHKTATEKNQSQSKKLGRIPYHTLFMMMMMNGTTSSMSVQSAQTTEF